KKREYVGLIHESSQSANSLLDNLLNWSRTQTDRIKFTPARIELFSNVLEIQRMLNSSMEKKNIHFENRIAENTFAWADPNMIQTIVRNLISNAIKFTPADGTIELSSESLDDRIMISVRDTGIGISEEKQKKLFDFGDFNSSSGTEGEHGTGLGLLICYEFVKKHGGNLIVKSKTGLGTTFTFDVSASEPGI
ncbi:sensor histidine kinase, partial [Bacteroidota bacterium]